MKKYKNISKAKIMPCFLILMLSFCFYGCFPEGDECSDTSIDTVIEKDVIEGYHAQFFPSEISSETNNKIGVYIDLSDGITKYLQEVLMPFMFVTLVLLFFMFNALRAKSLCPKFCGGRIVVIKKDTGPKVNKLKRKSLAVIQDMQKGNFNAHARHSKKSVTGSGLSALSQTFGNGIFHK